MESDGCSERMHTQTVTTYHHITYGHRPFRRFFDQFIADLFLLTQQGVDVLLVLSLIFQEPLGHHGGVVFSHLLEILEPSVKVGIGRQLWGSIRAIRLGLSGWSSARGQHYWSRLQIRKRTWKF